MIKITVHESVEAALRKAFPRPSATAQRALVKYVGVLEEMINAALQRGQTPEQKKLGLFSLSTSDLANRGGQVGPKKLRLHKWLRDNNFELVRTVVPGSKFSGQFSQVKLTALAQIENTIQDIARGLSQATSDEEIDAYLGGDAVSNAALFDHLYPEFKLEWREDKLAQLFEWLPVDRASLKAYVLWLETESKLISGAQKDQALRQALTIIGVATLTEGSYVQRKKPSPFGRMYYEGTSVQNVNKDLRRAMLGNCWEYDIRSSVIAWKMGFARSYLTTMGIEQTLQKAFPATLLYLEDKADFMATMRHFTFLAESTVPKDLQPTLLKKAFTAISFGARQLSKGWVDASGNWTNPALVEILMNSDDRKRFLADATVQQFILEQNTLDGFLYDLVKKHRSDLLLESYLQTTSGRPSKSKVLAYLYQHGETQVMDIVRRVAASKGHTAIANVHDAIFFKRRLGPELKSEIELQMRELTGNPYWHLTPKKVERYELRSLNEAREEDEHKKRMASLEAKAQSYVAKWPSAFNGSD